jgi:hypothetical protein
MQRLVPRRRRLGRHFLVKVPIGLPGATLRGVSLAWHCFDQRDLSTTSSAIHRQWRCAARDRSARSSGSALGRRPECVVDDLGFGLAQLMACSSRLIMGHAHATTCARFRKPKSKSRDLTGRDSTGLLMLDNEKSSRLWSRVFLCQFPRNLIAQCLGQVDSS